MSDINLSFLKTILDMHKAGYQDEHKLGLLTKDDLDSKLKTLRLLEISIKQYIKDRNTLVEDYD